MEKSIGREPQELAEAPELPAECTSVWDTFIRLSCCSYTEIKAYCDLTGDDLSVWEIDTLIGLDKIRNNPPEAIE